MTAASPTSALLIRTGDRTCVLNLLHVVEIMRPLPVEQVPNIPAFVSGLSIIRGVPTPVISLASLFQGSTGPPTRFVLVRLGERRVALAVDEVHGVFELDPAELQVMPPLAKDGAGTLEAIGALDAKLLFVLNCAHIMPEEVWLQLAALQP